MRERAWITDALKYVQYGNPDRTLLASNLVSESQAAAEYARAAQGEPVA
jgi:hypothetical protein